MATDRICLCGHLRWSHRLGRKSCRECDCDQLTGGLKPHGTHAAAERHRYHGQRLCDECRDAERARDRVRAANYRRRKAAAATTTATTEGTRAA